MSVCLACNGKGTVPCPECGGTGINPDPSPGAGSAREPGTEIDRCIKCAGTGEIICTHCGGTGKAPVRTNLSRKGGIDLFSAGSVYVALRK